MDTKEKVYFREAPHTRIEFPAFARKAGFEDISYGNDAAGHAVLELKGYRFDGATLVLNLWCDCAARDDREVESWPRFGVYVSREDEPEDLLTLYQGESESDAEQAVTQFLTLWTGIHPSGD